MSVYLLRTLSVVSDCENHLERTGTKGTEIESYLIQHALVVLCAEIQQEIYNIVNNSGGLIDDASIQKYLKSSGERLLRSIKKSEIVGYLCFFGTDIKTEFNSIIDDTKVTVYNTAVNKRHDVTHSYGAQMTLSDLKNTIRIAKGILNAIDAILITRKINPQLYLFIKESIIEEI